MFNKIIAFGATLAATTASLYSHGHAVSSQSIVRQDEAHVLPLYYAARVANYGAPVGHYAAPEVRYNVHDTHAYPKYEFAYSEANPHTDDHKSQHESRDGDALHCYYSLLQPDGSVRKVEYTADDHNGFNAVVHNSAPLVHPIHY